MPKITELWAYVCADTDEDDEGVPAVVRVVNGENYMFPLMGADVDRMLSLREEAQKLCNDLGKPVKMLAFKEMVVVDVLEPEGANGSVS